ncbi:transposase [Clostridium acetobutylicum]|nr:transposase [Clostridium acetobutylicum]
MSFSNKELMKLILENNPDIKTPEDVRNTLKDLFGSPLQQILESEMDNYLGYKKYDYNKKNTSNSRNGKSKKTMKSNLGLFDLDISRFSF